MTPGDTAMSDLDLIVPREALRSRIAAPVDAFAVLQRLPVHTADAGGTPPAERKASILWWVIPVAAFWCVLITWSWS
jgi:hypothetical protein